MRQRVLEGVLDVGEEARLVQELRGSQVREAAAHGFFVLLDDGLEEHQRDVVADDRGALEQPLVLGRQAVDPRRQGRLDARGRRDCLDRPCDAIGTPLTDQNPSLDQRPHALL